MADPIRRYNIITLRPHWAQYIISQGMSFIISCALFLVAGHDSITYKMPFVVLGGVMTCIMLYRCLYLYKLRYIITSEQLIIQHGVLTRTSDYIELYRVVDFSENRDILEQLFGLKTVWIFSGDRSNPKLDICVQVAGFVTLHYTGTTAPTVGECALAGDGKGGVAVTENAKKYRVLRVDTAAKTVGLYL